MEETLGYVWIELGEEKKIKGQVLLEKKRKRKYL